MSTQKPHKAAPKKNRSQVATIVAHREELLALQEEREGLLARLANEERWGRRLQREMLDSRALLEAGLDSAHGDLLDVEEERDEIAYLLSRLVELYALDFLPMSLHHATPVHLHDAIERRLLRDVKNKKNK